MLADVILKWIDESKYYSNENERSEVPYLATFAFNTLQFLPLLNSLG
jgi:hypothetical protein